MSELKPLFMKSMKDCVGAETKVAIALSGGKDSTTILFALLELGITPIAYSLHVDGNESTDYKIAKQTCKSLGVAFNEVILPKVADKQRIVDLIVKYDRVNKVDIECYYPLHKELGVPEGEKIPAKKSQALQAAAG